MIKYEWVISNLYCKPELDGYKNVVVTIHWRRRATRDDISLDLFGEEKIPFSEPESFTDYANLTFEQVCGWLTDSLGAEKIASLDAILAEQLQPPFEPIPLDLPWVAAYTNIPDQP